MNHETETDERERRVRREMMAKVNSTLGRVPFAEAAVAAYLCAIDSETPKRVKATLLGALVYFIMPVDAIPDIIAGLGFTDDAAVFWYALKSVRAHILPRHVEEAARRMAMLRGESSPGAGGSPNG